MRLCFIAPQLKVVCRVARRRCCRRCAAWRRKGLFWDGAIRHHLVRSWWSKNLIRSALTVGGASLLDWALADDVWPGIAIVDEQSRVAFACLTHSVEVCFSGPRAFCQVHAVVIEQRSL